MNSIRKYIRFYENNDEDMRILEKLNKYQECGFRSESQMIMEALRRYLLYDINNPTPEMLADMIAERLAGKLTVSQDTAPAPITEQSQNDDDVYDAALSFLETL